MSHVMQREKAQRLTKYFLNADPFLWGVLELKNTEANKRARIRELKESGFLRNYLERTSAIYGKINRDLLVELGIESILERIVIPRVTDAFADVLVFFRRCWEQGLMPDIRYLKQHKLYQTHTRTSTESIVFPHKDLAQVFVQIDTQHEFVERWTVFAGLWFEDIEPLFGLVPKIK